MTQHLPQPLPSPLVVPFGLPPQEERGPLIGDRLRHQDGLCGVGMDAVLRAHRRLAEAVGWALEPKQGIHNRQSASRAAVVLPASMGEASGEGSAPC